jgi:hypothetical protein
MSAPDPITLYVCDGCGAPTLNADEEGVLHCARGNFRPVTYHPESLPDHRPQACINACQLTAERRKHEESRLAHRDTLTELADECEREADEAFRDGNDEAAVAHKQDADLIRKARDGGAVARSALEEDGGAHD